MIYALRKLIAFVFLGGIFWFIYQDLDNLDKPWFMHALGMLVVVFAFFWLLIPMVVVWYRRRRRVKQNRERHAKWLAEGGLGKIKPHPAGRGKSANVASIGKDEKVFFHEKGTLYIDMNDKAGASSAHEGHPVGHPSDVAFPHFRRKCRVEQRTHCYFTNAGLAFAGKDIDLGIPFADLKSFAVEPGGIVFNAIRDGSAAKFAFTFQNPLVAVDVLRFAKRQRPVRVDYCHIASIL